MSEPVLEVDVQTRVIPLLAYLANGVADSLTTEVGRVVVAPGVAEAWDDCCDGQLYVRLARVEPRYSGRPGVDKHCTLLDWMLTVRVGVIRCAATVNDQGAAPHPDHITTDAFAAAQDMWDLYRYVSCFELPFVNQVTIGAWEPKGVDGGCHGGEMTLTLHLPKINPLPPPPLTGG